MTADDLCALRPKLDEFHRRFHRSEGRTWAQRYLTELNLPIEQKDGENIAEEVGASPRRLQQFVADSPWDDEGCVEELQRIVAEHLGRGTGC